MDKPLARGLEVACVINVDQLGGAVFTAKDGTRLFALRAYGEDSDAKEETSAALVFLPEELAMLCTKIARLMIDHEESDLLLKTWEIEMLRPRVD